MIQPSMHPKEEERLHALYGLNILDTPPEKRFDDITKEACTFFKVPMSTITLVDKDREWFKSQQGMQSQEGARSVSFCGHAMLANQVFIIEDATKDKRFADNPNVVGPPYIRFYAGVALFEKTSKLPVGVFCIKDIKPRKMNIEDIAKFLELAERAEREINSNNRDVLINQK